MPSTPLPAWPAGVQIVFMDRGLPPLPGVPSTPMPAMPGPGVPATPRPGWPAGAQRVTYRPAIHPPATPPAPPRPAAQNSAGVQSGQDVTQRIPSAPALAESAAQAEPGRSSEGSRGHGNCAARGSHRSVRPQKQAREPRVATGFLVADPAFCFAESWTQAEAPGSGSQPQFESQPQPPTFFSEERGSSSTASRPDQRRSSSAGF